MKERNRLTAISMSDSQKEMRRDRKKKKVNEDEVNMFLTKCA